MAIDDRKGSGLDLPRTDTPRPSGAIAGGGIGGAGMDTSGNAPNVSVGSRPEESDLGVRPGAGRVDDAGSMSSGSAMSGMAGGTSGMGSAAMAGGTTAGSYGASGSGMASGATEQGGLSSSMLERDSAMSHTSNAADGDMSENRLIAADRVVGTAVYDSDGNRIGSIDNLMIDKITGEVAYAVMSFGGFLGIGERYHPLPWDVLTYDTKLGGYNVGMAADNLREAPNYDRTELSSFHDNDYGSRVDNYYAGRMQSRDQGLSGGMTRNPAD